MHPGHHRVALIASSYHPHTGGVEEHVRALARELAGRGHHVAVWTVDRGERLGTREVDGIEVRYLPTPLPARSLRSLLSYGARLPSAITAWVRAYRSLRPTILNVQCFGPNGIYALALGRLTRTSLVISSHGETLGDDHDAFGQSALLRAALRRALSDADAVTGCSSIVINDLRARFGLASGSVVPNGIDPLEALDAALPPTWPSSGPIVLGLGRLEHNKGFDLLVRAFARVLSDGRIPPSSQLFVAGNGAARPSLDQLSGSLGIAANVTYPGRLNRSQVSGAMANADLVVVPSRFEAFGLVALEAWLGGTPLVMTSRGGASDFVTDGVDGLVVDPEDADAIDGAIASVLGQPELAERLAAAGSRRVRDFTWDRVLDAYLDVYDSAVSRRNPGSR